MFISESGTIPSKTQFLVGKASMTGSILKRFFFKFFFFFVAVENRVQFQHMAAPSGADNVKDGAMHWIGTKQRINLIARMNL